MMAYRIRITALPQSFSGQSDYIRLPFHYLISTSLFQCHSYLFRQKKVGWAMIFLVSHATNATAEVARVDRAIIDLCHIGQ